MAPKNPPLTLEQGREWLRWVHASLNSADRELSQATGNGGVMEEEQLDPSIRHIIEAIEDLHGAVGELVALYGHDKGWSRSRPPRV